MAQDQRALRSRASLNDVLIARLPDWRARSNLPAPLTSFVGRSRELTRLTARLNETRLLTLTGVGGVGKSRLAIEVARRMLDRASDEVWLVELAGIADPALAPRAVAAVLGVRETGAGAMTEAVVSALGERAVVLVLDNCEHLIEAVADLSLALLRGCPRLRILATSRRPLGLSGEVDWRVEPLAVPDLQHRPARSLLTRYPAVRLFVERARAARPELALTERNAEDVARICVRLDGLPLAIELAAARIAALSPSEISARLDDRFAFLGRPDRAALPRHRTLRESVDWSHELLSEPERVLFRRLSIFRGGWSLAAAERVCSGQSAVGSDQLDVRGSTFDEEPSTSNVQRPTSNPKLPTAYRLSPTDVVDLLAFLVDKSLVVATDHDGTTRYSFLETIRQYAADRLSKAGEEEQQSRRHWDWCVALAERAEPHLRGPDQLGWKMQLEDEHDNLRAALSRTSERGEAEPGLRIAIALWHFWNDRGYAGEGYAWLSRLLALDSAQGRTVIRAAALFLAAKLVFEGGDLATAQALGEESLAIARAVADPHALHRTLTQLGHIARGRGDWLAARRYYDEALPIRREVGEPADVAVSLAGLGHVARALREYAAAEALYRESLALALSQDDASDVTAGQHHLGRLAHERGRYDEAAAWYAEALPVAQRINHPRRTAYLLEAFASLVARRQPERALSLAGAAVRWST